MQAAWRSLSLAGLVASSAPALAAQTMEIRLRDEAGREPVVGAIVRLLDDRGSVAQGLSNESGWLVLRAPAAGNYRLKVDRIGWAGVMAGPYALGAGETLRRELHLTSERLELPALTVEGESACHQTSQGGALAVALWEEIRKALTASVISGESAELPLHVREFSRDLDLSGRPLRQHLVVSKITRGHTYSALSPEVLAKGGFVVLKGDRATYAAPDAKSLLSDEFVVSHCFRGVPGEGTLVGLAFEPVRDRPVTDVRGTLWVDRLTSELEFLEYRYTGLPDHLARGDLGGRVAFRRLPSGAWIVDAWRIRRPQLVREEVMGADRSPRPRLRATGYNDRGATVEIAADSLGRITRSILLGRVYDSIADRGLENAVVYVEGIADSIVTDSDGRFEFAMTASGSHVVAVRHRRVGLLGRPTGTSVTLTPGDTTVVDFAVPSFEAFGRTLCGAAGKHALVAGIITAADSTPVSGVDLRLTWKASTGERREARARSGARGDFALCGDFSRNLALLLHVSDGKRLLMERPVLLSERGVLWLEIQVPGR
jgi:hypothetical protein